MNAIGVSWTAVGSNGYELDASTASNFSGTLFVSSTSNGAATTLTATGLAGNTTYYLHAGALWNGTTNYAAVVSTLTLAQAQSCSPGSFSATGNAPCTLCAAGSIQPLSGQTSCSLCAPGRFQTQSGQTVCALCAAGAFQSNSGGTSCTQCLAGQYQDTTGATTCKSCLAGTTSNPGAFQCAEPLAGLTLAGTVVSSTTIQWSWTLTSGIATSFTLFTSTSGIVSGPLGPNASYYQETGLLAQTNYSRYVEALNGLGQIVSSTQTVATPVVQSFSAGTSSSTVTGTDGQKQLNIPAPDQSSNIQWLLSEDPIDHPLISSAPALIAAAASTLPAGLAGSADSLTEFIVAVNGSRFTGTLTTPVTVKVPYADANNDGIVDGTSPPVPASTLKLYVLNEATAQWDAIPGSTVDTTHHLVIGQISHLSIFNAFGTGSVAAANLDAVRVYPVPFKPNSGDPNQGVPYAPGNPNSGIVFGNLPAQVTIKIYTVTGKLVAEFSTNDSLGSLQWDARNSVGQDVASGGYMAVITSPGQTRVVKKLLVIR